MKFCGIKWFIKSLSQTASCNPETSVYVLFLVLRPEDIFLSIASAVSFILKVDQVGSPLNIRSWQDFLYSFFIPQPRCVILLPVIIAKKGHASGLIIKPKIQLVDHIFSIVIGQPTSGEQLFCYSSKVKGAVMNSKLWSKDKWTGYNRTTVTSYA